MTKTLTGYLLKVKGKKKLVVGAERKDVDRERFKMIDGCFIDLSNWNKKGELEDWAREQYTEKYSNGEVLDSVYFRKDSIESPEPYSI